MASRSCPRLSCARRRSALSVRCVHGILHNWIIPAPAAHATGSKDHNECYSPSQDVRLCGLSAALEASDCLAELYEVALAESEEL